MLLIIIICVMNYMFLASGVFKIKDFEENVTKLQKSLPRLFISDKSIITSKIGIVLAIIIQIICPIIIIYSSIYLICNQNTQYRRRVNTLASVNCIIIAIFTLMATYLFHFPPKGREYYPFISNITTVGGFLLLAHVFSNNWIGNNNINLNY